jgi:hypothetical protein
MSDLAIPKPKLDHYVIGSFSRYLDHRSFLRLFEYFPAFAIQYENCTLLLINKIEKSYNAD